MKKKKREGERKIEGNKLQRSGEMAKTSDILD